ncbi:hypothetical protein BSQ49_04310 [Liquorilactobacillus hordei]|uniref:Gram-positive cocci surface proteins LPxTG domain-containing protein n=1 Tax=Liquorilactobacillus hordei TaxID=468911 RepID=A0A3S6QRZ2_9LACO|nr:hypothetical protein BSQ49_04310 [Liquorilactobacillus hordei]
MDAKDSTLVAGPNTSWSAGDNFVDAKDADGNKVDLANITVSGNVDTTKAGSYEVTYSYTDKAGNVISKTATVTVVASQAAIDTKDSTLVAGPNTSWSAGDNFVDAKDADGNKVDLANITVSGNVDTTKAGNYEVTYSYTDKAGNVISKTATVTVVASQAVIDAKDSTLVAGPNTSWSAGDNFVDAKDADGNKVDLANITVSGNVDTTKAGSYEVTYSYTDKAGNVISKTATVTVVASQAAIDTKDSTLVAGPNTSWSAGDNFVDAKDADGNKVDLANITVSGNVDTTKAGNYEVTYSYTDKAGNVISKTATVTVVASQAVIDAKDSTLVAGPNTSWSAGDNFVDAKDVDGNKVDLANITVSGNVDTTKAGSYEVTYSYTDKAGNVISKTATVTVVASQAVIDAKDSTLVAGPNTSWSAGDNFVDAKDADGNKVDLANITVSGNVDTTKAGSYEVTYSYTDKAGNVISKTITVTVIAKQEPITPNHDDFNDNSGNNSTINDDTKSISTTSSVNTKMTKVVKAPNVVEKSSLLPQTGDEGSSETTIIGMILVILASVGSIFGLGKQNKNRN